MSTTKADTVAVFWDYENCPAPSNTSGYSIANNICTLARPFGIVKLFKAYLEIPDQFRSITIRSELQSSGVSLVDCPHNGRKEVADKMLLVDMLAYAIDNPAPSTIILITGDRDFAYALSILKHRRYQVVLVTLPNAHASLVHQACVTFDWFNDVINQLDTSNLQPRNKVQAQTLDVSKETRTSPYTLANDLTDPEESDYAYPRKQAQKDIYPTYSSGNTRAPNSPSKNSRNIPFQINNRTSSPTPPKPQTSHYRALESNIMVFDEDQTTMDACREQSPSKSSFRRRDGLHKFPASGNSRDDESNRRIPPPNQSLIGRVGSAPERSRSPSPTNSEPSSPPASSSPRKGSDHELDNRRPFIIPSVYVFLVKILQGHRRKGIIRSYRSVIGGKISVDHSIYRRVGVTTFAELMDLAERDGIVELGGGGRDPQWVRLLPDWLDAVPY